MYSGGMNLLTWSTVVVINKLDSGGAGTGIITWRQSCQTQVATSTIVRLTWCVWNKTLLYLFNTIFTHPFHLQYERKWLLGTFQLILQILDIFGKVKWGWNYPELWHHDAILVPVFRLNNEFYWNKVLIF